MNIKTAILGISLLITVGLAGYGWELSQRPTQNQSATAAQIDTASSPTPSPTPLIVLQKPVRLLIPKLDIDAFIEEVGLDDENRMDVPREDNNVAWYGLGSKPGEQGSAVLAGHYDTRYGGAAVFYRLDALSPGDEIVVEDENGQSLSFIVERVETYSDFSFPSEEVFFLNDKQRLNLITCAGQFDRGTANYSDRTVVFAIRKEG